MESGGRGSILSGRPHGRIEIGSAVHRIGTIFRAQGQGGCDTFRGVFHRASEAAFLNLRRGGFDVSKHSAHAICATAFREQLGNFTIARRSDLKNRLVCLDLDDVLIGLYLLAGLNAEADDSGFSHRLAELRHGDRDAHISRRGSQTTRFPASAKSTGLIGGSGESGIAGGI